MKHWQETGQVVEQLVRLARDGRRCALATVTRIVGSAYRRPGAKLLIEDGGAILGSVSGGCLEEDVRQVGLRAIESGRARLRRYATGDDEDTVWGLGLGCNGEVDVVVQAIAPEQLPLWERVRARLQGDAPFALVHPLEEGGPGGVELVEAPDPSLVGAPPFRASSDAFGGSADGSSRAGSDVFVECLTPPPRLLVCGAGEDARPLVAFASAAGFRVLVADHRPAFLTPARFSDARTLLAMRPTDDTPLPSEGETFAVVMTHSLARDIEWVRRLLESSVPYVGLLGPRARTDGLLARLGATGSDRVFGPVGLDLGADGPEQVALSIVSELLAVWSGREPRHLRERETAVHAER